jgi:Ser/Thr protein kinase RdoA (MazF antagonist)
MPLTHARAAVEGALRSYSFRGVSLRLLAHAHNTTFAITDKNGRRAVIKAHRPGSVVHAEVLSEMQWLAALAAQTSLLIPVPIRNRKRELITEANVDGEAGPWLCRITRWVPGRKLGRGLRPKHFARLGELIAGLHQHVETFEPPVGFVRPQWDKLLLTRMAPLRQAGRDGRLSARRSEIFEAAFDRASRAMRDLGKGPNVFRLIHSDLGYGNHVFHQARAGAIDFETCGFGYILADLAEPLCFMRHWKNFMELRSALLDGYRSVREFSKELEVYLPDFLDFAAVTTLGYIAGEPARAKDLDGLSAYLAKVSRQ